jgi:NADH:ubiquinone oxidoreductase subunit
MSLDSLLIKLLSKKVGSDQFGNEYFVGKRKNYLGRQKRFVVYKGIAEGSKVPALWHAWLHYLSDEIPENCPSYDWQQEHIPNVTGTKYAYNPREYSFDRLKSYVSWSPRNNKG